MRFLSLKLALRFISLSLILSILLAHPNSAIAKTSSPLSNLKNTFKNFFSKPIKQIAVYLVAQNTTVNKPAIETLQKVKPKIEPSAQQPEGNFENGLKLFQDDQYDKALLEFQNIIDVDANNAEATYFLGLTYFKLEDHEKAIPLFKKALELDPEFKESYLSLGISYYKNKSYDLALNALSKALEANPKDASSHFFKGLTLHSLEKYQDSLFSFNQAKTLDPEFRQLALFYKALGYYKLGQVDYAKDLFKRTADFDPTSDTAKDANQFIDIIKQQQASGAGKDWYANVNAGYEWNDNISRSEQDIVTNQADRIYIFQASGNYTFFKKKSFELDAGYNFYQSIYDEAKEFNYQAHTGNLSASYGLNDWDLRLDTSYTYSTLDKLSFLGIETLSPAIGHSFHPKQYINASYSFQRKTFFTDSNRDGMNHSIGFINFLFFWDNKAFWSLGYRFSDENTRASQFDYANHHTDTTIKIPGPFESVFRFYYAFFLRDYKNITESITGERQDDRQTFQISYYQPIYKKLYLDANYRHIEAKSNVSSVDFKENSGFVSLGINF
jgi:tetratricopeptide (TPR) repeat protein